MASKTMVELQADINSLFPDNTTGSITPALLRQFCSDFVTSMTPAYGAIGITLGTLFTMNITPAIIPWTAELAATAPEYTTTLATGAINRVDGVCTNQLTFNVDVELPNGRVVYATLYKNGVATLFRATASGRGSGSPSILSFDAIDYSAVPVTYQVFFNSDIDGIGVTLSNVVFLARALPVRSA